MQQLSPKRRIVLFNGPPGCGKDEAALVLQRHLNFVHLKFADPVKDIACSLHGVTRDWFDSRYTRELKDQPMDELAGFSPREALWDVAEVMMKPIFGGGVFGYLLCDRIERDHPTEDIVISDLGFIKEARAINGRFLDSSIVLVVQVEREGCRFTPKTDTRRYVFSKARTVNLTNDCENVNEWRSKVMSFITHWCNTDNIKGT